jgi:hypothetical protein
VRPSPNSPAIAAAAAAAAAVATQQKPFAEVVKEAKEQPGFFNLYSKDERSGWRSSRSNLTSRSSCRPIGARHRRSRSIPQPDAALRYREFHRIGNLV